MKNRQCKGFTLIELLVVIAIIGILASVVLASLNTAREKGADANIRSNINNMRAQAELYYDSNSLSYTNLCIQPELLSAENSINNAGGTFDCSSNGSEFRISSVLSDGSYFCVDNEGFAGGRITEPTTSTCPAS